MDDLALSQTRTFMHTHARLIERALFAVRFDGETPEAVARALRAYQNADGGLGHALEPDVRCAASQPLFAGFGLGSLREAGCRDADLAMGICRFMESVADADGLVPPLTPSAMEASLADHWRAPSSAEWSPLRPGLNPTMGVCGLLHFQGVEHPWLSKATHTCVRRLLDSPPLEAHALIGAALLGEHLPDRAMGEQLLQTVADALPTASFYIPEAPVKGYGLTPLNFATTPDSPCRRWFTDAQIEGHLKDLISRRQPDGGWPITWDPPGPAAELEWRGRVTCEALYALNAYGVV